MAEVSESKTATTIADTRMGEQVTPVNLLPGQLFAPSADRNRAHIAKTLAEKLPADQPLRLLEVASGTGQHVALLAKTFPAWTLTPSDLLQEHLASVRAYVAAESLANVYEPLQLDATAHSTWPLGPASMDVVLNINMIHISPWAACQGLIEASARILCVGGHLVFYGPFKRHGVLSPESNVAFDQSLRTRDAAWGLRDIVDVSAAAAPLGFALVHEVAMPANNFMLFYRKERS